VLKSEKSQLDYLRASCPECRLRRFVSQNLFSESDPLCEQKVRLIQWIIDNIGQKNTVHMTVRQLEKDIRIRTVNVSIILAEFLESSLLQKTGAATYRLNLDAFIPNLLSKSEVNQLGSFQPEYVNAGSEKVWLQRILKLFDPIGSQKLRILATMLDCMNDKNEVHLTNKQIAYKCKVSEITVKYTVEFLMRIGFLQPIGHDEAFSINLDLIFQKGLSEDDTTQN